MALFEKAAHSAINRLPTFAVVGLRFGQAARVEARCADLAILKFVNADQSETVLPESDAIILLTRFIRHRWTQASLQTLPRNRVHLHGGGITSLVGRIRSLAGTTIHT